jgi:hypothetical protein
MKAKGMRRSGLVGLMVMIGFLVIFGCGKEQAPPPVQTPPPAAAPAPAQPAAPATTPAPGQPVAPTAAPAGPGQPVAAGAPTQDASQVQMGMSGEDVKKIMGEPGQTKQKGAMVEWKYMTPKGKVEFKLQDNKVVEIEKH